MSDHNTLYVHIPHPHKPVNVNKLHAAEQTSLNNKIALLLTKSVGSMWTAYLFALLALVGLLAILGLLTPIVALLIAWVSQTFIQLVLLPVIMVGQQVLSRKQELQSEEQYNTTMKSYHDLEQVMQHLVKIDEELLKHTQMLTDLAQHVPTQPLKETKKRVAAPRVKSVEANA